MGYYRDNFGGLTIGDGSVFDVTTPNAVIVYDNTDGTYGPNPTTALPLVLPFMEADINGAMNAPWVMQTELSNIPEPASMLLMGLGGLAVLARRRRASSKGK